MQVGRFGGNWGAKGRLGKWWGIFSCPTERSNVTPGVCGSCEQFLFTIGGQDIRASGQDIRAKGDRIFGVSACGTAGLGFVRVHVL